MWLKLITAGSVAAVIGVVGCASGPNTQLKEARVAEAEANREQRVEQAEAQRKASEEQAGRQRELAEKRAEPLPSASENRADAQAKMVEARRVYEAKVIERLNKADALLIEARNKVQIASSRVPSATRTRIDNAVLQRNVVADLLNRMQGVSNEEWSANTKRIDGQLDQLDQLVSQAKDAADHLPGLP